MEGGAMVEIVYYAAVSLDGFIATPDGGVDWLPPIEAGGEDYGYSDFYASVDAILMGSATYENILRHAAWPYPDKKCWVFSKQRRYAKSSDASITFTGATPDYIVEELAGLGSSAPGSSAAASSRHRSASAASSRAMDYASCRPSSAAASRCSRRADSQTN
jgi:hypothetical protein